MKEVAGTGYIMGLEKAGLGKRSHHPQEHPSYQFDH